MREPGEEPRRALIARRIREARKMAGISQGQVATLLGLHRPSVSEIEAGNRRVTADELAQLAELFDVNVSWLLGQGEQTLNPADPRVQLAAREMQKLKSDDLDRLLTLLAAMRQTADPRPPDKDEEDA